LENPVSSKKSPPKNQQAALSFGLETLSPKHDSLVAYVDGGSRGNPGPAGAGIYLERGGQAWRGLYRYLGRQTNNYAEYSALLEGLQYGLQQGFRRITLYADSELLVRQMLGVYRVKNPVLQQLHGLAKTLAGQLQQFTIRHIPREKNSRADSLANKAQDLQQSGEEHYDS
jgi:ribonuclease HI